MARALSEEKREAILTAAAELVAAQGTGAPTSGIAKQAGFAEGTLFTYFATKDDLLNTLYLDIEADLAKTMLESYPHDSAPRERARHMWDRFIDWGAANPVKRKAIRQLKISDRITAASRRRGDALFRDVKALLEETLSGHVKAGQSSAYTRATMDTLASMTFDFIAREPGKREHYKRAGFDVFWKGLAG